MEESQQEDDHGRHRMGHPVEACEEAGHQHPPVGNPAIHVPVAQKEAHGRVDSVPFDNSLDDHRDQVEPADQTHQRQRKERDTRVTGDLRDRPVERYE